MHFYDFNIGDYAKKTQHLTNEEDLAYRRALDMYYDTEQPFDITSGLATLSRRLRVSEKSLKIVIEEFFPDGKNKHADEKISEYHAYLERQKLNGSKGGRPKHRNIENPVVSQNNPVPSQPLPTNHEPLTNNKTIVISKADKQDCPHQEIVSLYHEILPMLPRVKSWTNARQKKLKARWSEDISRQNLEYWRKFFEYVKTCKFLLGKNDRTWTASLDFLVTESKFVKIIEGEYEFAN
jgi:uncharacterized protein YdaU (DUF1376 family)